MQCVCVVAPVRPDMLPCLREKLPCSKGGPTLGPPSTSLLRGRGYLAPLSLPRSRERATVDTSVGTLLQPAQRGNSTGVTLQPAGTRTCTASKLFSQQNIRSTQHPQARQTRRVAGYPTEPSSLRDMSSFTSAANSRGSSLKTCRQKPEMMTPTASSGSTPRCWK